MTRTPTIYSDIEIERASPEIEVLYRGMKIGAVIEDPGYGYLFTPHVEFHPDEMDACDADTLDALVDRIESEIQFSRDLLTRRSRTAGRSGGVDMRIAAFGSGRKGDGEANAPGLLGSWTRPARQGAHR